MGILVCFNDITLWEPALATGQLFEAQARAMERLVGTWSGILDIVSDEMTVVPELLLPFIRSAVTRLERSNNRPLLLMSAGCLLMMMALRHRLVGEPVQFPPNIETALIPVADPFSPVSGMPAPLGCVKDWTVSRASSLDQPDTGDRNADIG